MKKITHLINTINNLYIYSIKNKYLITLLIAMVVLGKSFGQSSLPTFSCPSIFYQVINGELRPFNPADGTYGDPIGGTLQVYNAGGYNTTDDYLYAIVEQFDVGGVTPQSLANHLIRIGSDGNFEDLGVLDDTATNFIAGEVFNNTLYLRNGRTLTRVFGLDALTEDLSGTTVITTSTITNATWNSNPGQMNALDIVYINGSFYGADGTSLFIWDIVNDERQILTITGDLPTTGVTNYGAVFTDDQDRLYIANNGGTGLFLIENYATSPVASIVSASQNTQRNDGFSCGDAPSPIDEDNDGILNPFDIDVDGDGITNIDESPSDPFADNDSDLVYAYLDDNDANNTIGNDDGLIESTFDTDGDGVPDFFDLDSDNDGIYDVIEAGHGEPHTNGRISDQDSDSGTNGLDDDVETFADSGIINYTCLLYTSPSPRDA